MKEAFKEYIKFDAVEEPNPLLQNERYFAVWDTAWQAACKWQIEQEQIEQEQIKFDNIWWKAGFGVLAFFLVLCYTSGSYAQGRPNERYMLEEQYRIIREREAITQNRLLEQQRNRVADRYKRKQDAKDATTRSWALQPNPWD